MNRYPSISTKSKLLLRKPIHRTAENGRVRLSVTRWEQTKFMPMIVRHTPASRLIFFNS